MENITLNTTINGKKIVIKNGLTWGELKTLVKIGVVNGQMDVVKVMDYILKTVIVSGIDTNKLTDIANLDGLEMTQLMGEISEKLPLEKYLTNLGMAKNLIENQENSTQT